jgi:hypothetical protein
MAPRSLSLIFLAVCLCAGLAPARAQVVTGARDPALQRTQPGLPSIHATPFGRPAFRLEPYDAFFISRPFDPRPFLSWVSDRSAATRGALPAEQRLLADARLRRHGMGAAGGPAAGAGGGGLLAVAPLADSVEAAAAAAGRAAAAAADSLLQAQRGELPGGLRDLADIGVRVVGSGDFGGSWTRYRPCDQGLFVNCNPGMFPQLRPDVQFGVQVGGTISERIHVDVDYDQTREFDAANSINLYYQGLAHEVLQRVEVGDVSIRLPSSRYMTRGVPAGNFGLMASAQLGPLDIQTVFAQQKGDVTTREFRLGRGAEAGLEQDATLVLDDAEYVKGQFFFLVDPSLLRGYPHIDVLSLLPTDAPAGVRPGAGGTIELYRDERMASFSQNAQLGYFLADALPPGGGLRHAGSFRRMLQEQDYIVHSSGLWVMLRSPLRGDEALAVSYLTEMGDTVGRLGAESARPGETPRLRLLRGPFATHQPGSGTWPLEMKQVYRLDSSTDVDLASIDLRISLGELAGGRTFRNVLGQQLSFLRLFGLDEDAPADRLDAAQVYQPARETFSVGPGTPIGGTFIVLPTLRPFAQPAPLASLRIGADDLAAALGRDANVAIYDDPDPVTRAGSGRFRLTFAYRVRVEGVISSFSLGAFGVREGSERLTLGGRLLERNLDYTIDYDVGMVMLTDAQRLLGTAPDTEIRATWEQKALFDIAPTSILGASARYSLGPRGELNFVGLYQAEKSLMTRPQLGVEPGAALLGGASGRFDLGGALLDRMLGAVPGLRAGAGSAMSLTGELAFSLPNPNRRGAAYLDDFEASDELTLRPRRQDWRLGSAPQSSEGDRGTLPFVLDAATATTLVWQHDFQQEGATGGMVFPRNIDRQINLVGTEMPEHVMWLTFGRQAGATSPLPDPGDPRRWRSITTVLSATGHDLSRAEYLEFYVNARGGEPLALIFDVGTVGEDGFYMDSLGRTSGVYPDGTRWGLGVLDEEASLINREVWGTERDRRGLWDQQCMAEPLIPYPLGDPRANCTRNNGIPDSEDLNGNGILDADDGQYFRYVVQLDRISEYLMRDTVATGTGYRLYRIPLRSGTAVNGANEGTWRFIRHLRLTVAGEPAAARTIALARMRIIGSRWTKRDVHGIQRGMFETTPGSGANTGEVRVGPVSRLTDGAQYTAPPGVIEQLQDRSSQFGVAGHEINTKSLRLAYSDLEPGDRAEVYYRYPQQPRNLLTYRELRLWVLPREGSWGPSGEERFSIRIGTDARNFYLYQSRLRPATGPRAAQPADWTPELVIDFQQWLDLKARAERLLIERGPRIMGVDTLWSADSTYALVLEDRARAPNLAAVRELVFAVYNGGALATTGEVWIDELRVSRADTDPGAAGNIHLDVRGGDFVNASLSLANQGALFRQLGETPHYVGGADVAFSADARLDRLLPERWGIDLPLSVSHMRNAQEPHFLQQSDVEASQLDGLRHSGSDATRVAVRLSRSAPLANPWLGLLLDGAALRVGYTAGSHSTVTSKAASSGFTGDVSYRREPVRRDFGVVPGPAADALRALAPNLVERSDAFDRLLGSRLRWSPATLSFGSAYSDQLTRSFHYERILALPGDTGVAAIESPRQGMRNELLLGLRPFEPLTASFTLSSDRDVLDSRRASTGLVEQRALEDARTSIGGLDIGWEMARVFGTAVNYRPQITPWLRAGWSYGNRYMMDRNPSWLHVREDGTAVLQRRFESSRQLTRTLTLQPHGAAIALGADSAGVLTRLLRRVDGVDAAWRGALSSQYDRRTFTPGIGYQLGIGDMQSFRVMGADTAARVQERDNFTLGSSVRLLPNARLEVSYSNAETESFDARGGTRTTREVGWPRASLQWRDVAIPSLLRHVFTSATATGGVQRIERTQQLGIPVHAAPGFQPQLRGGTELNFPFSLTLGMHHGVTLGYRGSYATGETLDPTGDARSGGYQQDVTLSGVVQPPARWREKLDGPIVVTLNYADQQQRQCRYSAFAGADEGCVAFLDLGTRNANARIETRVSDLDVGLLFNFAGRQSYVGMRNGSSQFQLGVYGRFNFEAGQMSAILPRRQF